jgi:hypothetical protein
LFQKSVIFCNDLEYQLVGAPLRSAPPSPLEQVDMHVPVTPVKISLVDLVFSEPPPVQPVYWPSALDNVLEHLFDSSAFASRA